MRALVAASPNGEVGGVGLRHSPEPVLAAERAWRRRRELRLLRTLVRLSWRRRELVRLSWTLFGTLRRRLGYRHSRKLRNQTGHGWSMLRNAHRHLRRSYQRHISFQLPPALLRTLAAWPSPRLLDHRHGRRVVLLVHREGLVPCPGLPVVPSLQRHSAVRQQSLFWVRKPSGRRRVRA